ncbi:MAG: hypothetical protein R6V33_10585 [Pelovirga sp.]
MTLMMVGHRVRRNSHAHGLWAPPMLATMATDTLGMEAPTHTEVK